jgi:hypothetical protein
MLEWETTGFRQKEEADILSVREKERFSIIDIVPREFDRRLEGMIFAMDGGLWLHRHTWKGHAMAHLISTDREALIRYGIAAGCPLSRLQYKPLKDPRTSVRVDAWHWDLVGRFLPARSRDGSRRGGG